MTTYGFNLKLDEQELWAVKEAIDFYLTSEALQLRKKHPFLVKYAADIRLKEILASGKLYEGVELKSRNSFGKQANEQSDDLSTSAYAESLLYEMIVDRLRSSSQLSQLALTPVAENFSNNPLVYQLILDCIFTVLDNSNTSVKAKYNFVFQDEAARTELVERIGGRLYLEFTSTKDSAQQISLFGNTQPSK